MTDKLSERAEQLTVDQVRDCFQLTDWWSWGDDAEDDRYGEKLTKAINSVLQSLATDSANLARGLAIEQAAQLSKKWRKWSEIDQRVEDSDPGDGSLMHGTRIGCADELDEAIRSLAPDAAHDAGVIAQFGEDFVSPAIARAKVEWEAEMVAHDEDIERQAREEGVDDVLVVLADAATERGLIEGFSWNSKKHLESARKFVAEIELRARLDECDVILKLATKSRTTVSTIQINERIAALAESQPHNGGKAAPLVTCDHQPIPHRQADSEVPCKNPKSAPAKGGEK